MGCGAFTGLLGGPPFGYWLYALTYQVPLGKVSVPFLHGPKVLPCGFIENDGEESHSTWYAIALESAELSTRAKFTNPFPKCWA